jgi:hypothetical protein
VKEQDASISTARLNESRIATAPWRTPTPDRSNNASTPLIRALAATTAIMSSGNLIAE